MTFSDLGLDAALVRTVEEKGYLEPSPIQAQAIPAILQGSDIMAAAQTGTGKTAGFTLPLLHRLNLGKPVRNNRVRALVLTPTRELAAQVHESVQTYGQHLKLQSSVVFGGVKINPQMMRLRRGADILVATPGRLIDLYEQNALQFNDLEILVLDEADRMLDMGFINDIRKILALLPKKRQNLLFSATFSDDIRKLAKGLLKDPLEISVSPQNSTAPAVEQIIYEVDKTNKTALLAHLIKEQQWNQVLVFGRTKHGADRLVRQLTALDIPSAVIHGNRSQNQRTEALAGFKQGKVQVLVATDIAARGIDIDQLPYVVNYDLPQVAEDYVHRIGRTGRAGASGYAISLVSMDEKKQLVDIEKLTKQKFERQQVLGFEPDPHAPKTDTKPKNSQNIKSPNSTVKVKMNHSAKALGAKSKAGAKPKAASQPANTPARSKNRPRQQRAP
ncbi:DEAD/DEAH box helicase [Thiolinea disciformis]|uniref:DEAD/DEAH box helicase n=1 Tax=Thiolinea disciformis TaxID=125614 RepID=UPI0003632196|nr:DEAD/DEAH box helicase [Thiolinea disciformis]